MGIVSNSAVKDLRTAQQSALLWVRLSPETYQYVINKPSSDQPQSVKAVAVHFNQ